MSSTLKHYAAAAAAFLASIAAFNWDGIIAVLPGDSAKYVTIGLSVVAFLVHLFTAISKSATPAADPSASTTATGDPTAKPSTPVQNLVPLLMFAAIATFALGQMSCGTEAGKDAAGIISSPATKEIVDLAVKAGESALINSTGKGLSDSEKALWTTALDGLASTATDSALNGIASALAGKGDTAAAADSGQLVAAVTSAAPVPVATAVKVAEMVPTAVNSSGGAVTPQKANAAVVVAVKDLAGRKRSATQSTGK